MLVAMLWKLKPEVVVGFFAWEDGRWNLYASASVKNEVEKVLNPVPDLHIKQPKFGEVFGAKRILTIEDRDYMNFVNYILRRDLPVPHAVEAVKKVTKAEFDLIKGRI